MTPRPCTRPTPHRAPPPGAVRAGVRVCTAATLLVVGLAGCSAASNPVGAGASVAIGALGAGQDTQVTAALTTANQAVAAWQAEQGRIPTAAEFAGIAGAARSAAVQYLPDPGGAGYCLTATSTGNPPVTRSWRSTSGLLPAGAGC